MIESDKGICSGAPRIEGKRITVYNIISDLFYNDDLVEYVRDFGLNVFEVKEAVDFCIAKKCYCN